MRDILQNECQYHEAQIKKTEELSQFIGDSRDIKTECNTIEDFCVCVLQRTLLVNYKLQIRVESKLTDFDNHIVVLST